MAVQERAQLAEQIWWILVGSVVVMLVLSLVAYAVDKRTLQGASVWAKPIKFQLAVILHFGTLALLTRYLSEPVRASTVFLAVVAISVVATVGELAYIAVQAARQQPSHFNTSTPAAAAMYSLMAAGAVAVIGAAGAVGIAFVLDGRATVGEPLRHAIALGLIGGTILTMIVAFTLGGRMSHHVGIEPPGAPRMPFTGWSLVVGDLRAPHFFATHMVQAVPLAGLVIERIASGPVAIAGVWASAILWAALTVWLFRNALAGLPIGGFGS